MFCGVDNNDETKLGINYNHEKLKFCGEKKYEKSQHNSLSEIFR